MSWLKSWLRLQPIPTREPPEITALMGQLDHQAETAQQSKQAAERIASFDDAFTDLAGKI